MNVSKRFKESFDLCMKHYACSDEEIEFEKERVRMNYKDAELCFLSIAGEITGKAK